MKLITLNIWGGRVQPGFTEFITTHRDVDVFCLQEVYKDAVGPLAGTPYVEVASHESFYQLQKLLPEHEIIFHPAFMGVWRVHVHKEDSPCGRNRGSVYLQRAGVCTEV